MTNEEFKELIRKHGSNYALITATRKRNPEQIKMALDAGADIDTKAEEYGAPLVFAASNGYTKTAKLLIDNGANVNAKRYYFDLPPLMCATANGHAKTAKLLIDNGANVNAKDNHDYTPLIWAAIGGNTKTAKLLIDNGANVNAKDDERKTPLMHATMENRPEIVKLLIAAEADVNAKDHERKTPLMFAMEKGYTEITILLIKKGANVNAKDINGDTAFDKARRHFSEISKAQKQDPEFRAELFKTKEHLQSKPRIKGVSGVVIADKITEMKYSDKIHGDISPTLGKRLREKITKEMMMQLKQR